MKLFRPVGLYEMEKIFDSDFQKFPPRFDFQPIFYPVTNEKYAQKIARDWNTKDPNSGYAGFVTSFMVSDKYLSDYETHLVGSSLCEEYWIPSEDLENLNKNIIGQISVLSLFLGLEYEGYNSNRFTLGKKNIKEQLKILTKMKDYGFDFYNEMQANKKMFYFNLPFWKSNMNSFDIAKEEIIETIQKLEIIWNGVPISPKFIESVEIVKQ